MDAKISFLREIAALSVDLSLARPVQWRQLRCRPRLLVPRNSLRASHFFERVFAESPSFRAQVAM